RAGGAGRREDVRGRLHHQRARLRVPVLAAALPLRAGRRRQSAPVAGLSGHRRGHHAPGGGLQALAVLPVEVQLRERRGLDMEAGAPPGVGLQPARDGGPRLPGGAEGGAVALEPGAGGLASAPRRRRHLRGCCATVVGTKKMPEKKSSHARGSYCTPFLDPAL
ncbi:unnamed protein product, partial [Prorocentrum cordatum]